MRAGAIALLTGLAALAALGPAGAGRKAGVYTAQQASEGARIYALRCAMCHGGQLQGSVEIPALTGRFVANWATRPLGDLYDYVGRAMPQPAPGSLTPQDNARLTAFLLQANGYPAGPDPLPADAAALRRMNLGPPRVLK